MGTFYGTRYNDVRRVWDGNENDVFIGFGEGRDSVSGNGGNDTFHMAIDYARDFTTGGNALLDTVFGGAGNDLVTFAYSDRGVKVDLADGDGAGLVTAQYPLFSYVNNGQLVTVNQTVQVTSLYGVENVTGTPWRDTLNGNSVDNLLQGMGGNDSIDGEAGNDKIVGGLGQDTLTGGADSDTFVFLAASESTNQAADTILDFVHGADRIDLSLIDANANLSGNQAFDFVGGSFDGDAGDLKAVLANVGGQPGWLIQGDTNGDQIADFSIAVTGTAFEMHQQFSDSDFLL